MKCGNCEADIIGSELACHSCGTVLRAFNTTQAAKKISYAHRRYTKNPPASFRAKLGFRIQADTLPVPPPHTASAARPAPFVSRKRNARIQTMASISALMEKPAVIAARLHKSLEARKAAKLGAVKQNNLKRDNFKPIANPRRVKPPEVIVPRRLPVRPRRPVVLQQETSSHLRIAGGILAATLTLGLGVAWWLNNNIGAGEPYSAGTLAMQSPLMANKMARQINEQRSASPATRPVIQIENQNIAPPAIALYSAPSQAQIKVLASEDSLHGLRDTDDARPASSDKAVKALAISASEESDKFSPRKKSSEKSRNSSKKLAETTKKERVKEIDRVRTQAFSETKSDRLSDVKNRGSGNAYDPQSSNKRKPSKAAQMAKASRTKNAYARCESRGNLIQRERCKWEVCSSSWGKNGCPSYAQNETFIY